MAEMNIGFSVILNLVLCLAIMMIAWWDDKDKFYVTQLNLSGVISALNIIIAILVAIDAPSSKAAFTSFAIGIVGFFGLVGMITKKNSTCDCDVPNTYPFYITVTSFVILLSMHYSIYYIG